MNRGHLFVWLLALITSCLGCSSTPHPSSQSQTEVLSTTQQMAVLGLPGIAGLLAHHSLQGSVHIYDEENNNLYHSDSAGYDHKNVPASTFKIITSLLALEKGLLQDQYEIKTWNNRIQKNSDWNKDQHLKEAFALSTNWFFEDLTAQLGTDTINAWLLRIGYPATIQQAEAKFWLDPQFVISPREQITLMQKLYHQTLPFSARTYELTKNIMLRKDTLGVQIYGKTGWGTPEGKNVGWYVGWAECSQRKPIFFATCIEQAEPASEEFAAWRKELTEMALLEAFPQLWKTTGTANNP
jgi:beta-lactamase class D